MGRLTAEQLRHIAEALEERADRFRALADGARKGPGHLDSVTDEPAAFDGMAVECEGALGVIMEAISGAE